MPTTLTLPSPADLITNPFYRRVLAIALLFVAFVVWPQVFGVGPLSSVAPASLVSADYNPADNYLLMTVNLFQGVDAPSEVIGVQLSPSSRDAYKIALPETFLSATITHSELHYNYIRSDESLPYVACFSAEATVSAGKLQQISDLARAALAAYDKIVSQYGDPNKIFGPGNYKLIILDTHFTGGFLMFGGDAYAKVLLCGYIPDRYYLYSQSGSPQLRTCFTLSLKTADGKTAATTKEICNDVGAGTIFNLVSNGVVVGSVTYNGMKTTYLPADLATFPADKLLVNRYALSSSISDTNFVTGVYLLSPSLSATLSQYDSLADTFRSQLQSATIVSCRGYVTSSVVDTFSKQIPVPFVVYKLPNGYCEVAGASSPDYWQTTYDSLRAYLKDLLRQPLSSVGYRYSARLPSTITLIRDATDISHPLASHEVSLRLNAKFTGLYYLRAHPRILAVSPVGKCTDTMCTLSIRLKNDTSDPHEVGPVTINVSGRYLSGQTVVSFDAPDQEKTVTLDLFPHNVTSTTTDTITVTATASHPIDPVIDRYSTSVTIEKTPTCDIQAPRCYYDENRGLWYYLTCPSKYSSPQQVWCQQGQGCQDGTGCVNDVITSVSCLDTRTYSVHYQYAGNTTGVCPASYVCDQNKAAQNIVPPCRPQSPVPTPTPTPTNVTIHVAQYRPSLKDIATGLAVVGIALLVMP